MARETDPKVIEKVVAAIETHPDGMTIEQIETALGVPRRTLLCQAACWSIAT